MRANSNPVHSFLVGATVLVLAATSPWKISGEEIKPAADKVPILTLDEKYEKLKGGLFKLRESDVLALLGPAQSMTRPGKQDKADIEMRWEYATRIVVTYKDGNVSEVWGTFSEHLPVTAVTAENFRRVQVGMSEREVIEILGDRYASVGMNGVVTGQWGASAELKVAFTKDNRMVHHERSGNSYGSRKSPMGN